MGTDYIFANAGQLIRFVIQTVDGYGNREDGYVPIVESVIFPDLSFAAGYPAEMLNLATGLYAHGLQLPTGADALGSYIANIYWTENGLSKWQAVVINVAKPFGASSVSPV